MIANLGAACFGLVAGYICYRTLVRSPGAQISDLAAVLSAVGGGATVALTGKGTDAFGWYAIGLAAGMAVYFGLFYWLNGRREAAVVLRGGDDEGKPR